MTDYIIKGFILLNKNIEIFLFIIPFVFIHSLDTLLPQFLPSWAKDWIVLLLILPVIYEFSVPKLLACKLENKALDISYILKTYWANLKRMIIPGSIFLICIFLIFILFAMISLPISGETSLEEEFFKKFFSDPSSSFNIFGMIFGSLLGALLIFAPTLFSIENNNFFSSLKKSFRYALKKLSYSIFIFIVLYITGFIHIVIYHSSENLGPFISALVYEYVIIGLYIGAFLFYKDNIKGKI